MMNRSVLKLCAVEDGVKIARSYTSTAHVALKSSDLSGTAEAIELANDRLGDVLMLIGVVLAEERKTP